MQGRGKWLTVEQPKDSVKRVMRRNAIVEVKKGLQKGLLLLTLEGDLFIVIRSTDNGEQGDDQNVEQVIFFASVKSEIRHIGEESFPVHPTKV